MSRFFQTYEQVVEFLFGRINYERMAGVAYSSDEMKLERMRQLLSRIGRPQDRLRVVHVTGTKGKGSTAVMAAEILSAAGYRTGLFTSPHVSTFEERMVVNGQPPSSEHLVELVNRLVEGVRAMDGVAEGQGPTYFELATALAWLYFLDREAEIAVLEVGLGGRLDATNVCHPLVGVITNISRDHTNVLGSSLSQIAREKAGIVKPGVPLISGVAAGPAGDVVAEVCKRAGSPLYRLEHEIRWRQSPESSRAVPAELAPPGPLQIDLDVPCGRWRDLPVPLRGLHQADNTALAVAAVGILRERGLPISPEAVPAGLSRVRWPARIEVIATHPTVVVDAAHNWASTQALVRTLAAEFSARRRILVFAATRDKDISGILRLLLPRFDSVVLTQYGNNPRAVGVDELDALVRATSPRSCHIARNPSSAWGLARQLATAEDLVCITGSFFIAAELRHLILEAQGASKAVAASQSSP